MAVARKVRKKPTTTLKVHFYLKPYRIMKNQLLILAILAVATWAKPLNDDKEPPNTIDKATGGGTLELRRRIEKPNGGPGPGGHDGMADHHATLRDILGSFNNDKIPYGPIRGPNEAANRNLRDLSGSEGVNVALGKTAYQTTTEHHTRAASRAVDGNTDTNFFSGTCTHTADAGETDPSWWVDLGQSYVIARVVIFNRQDGSQDRLNPFNIHIGDSDQVSMNPKCGGDHRIALDRPSISVSCLWMMGRYVGVRLPGPSRILTLCEVQVYTGVNVALGKTAYQTTTEHHTRAASRAVDGNTDTNFFSGTCTHTADAGETDPSWWVDLGQSYMIARVVIFNRQDGSQDRLNPFNIHIGDSDQVSMNPKCGGDHRIALDRPSISVSCLWMMGRYVGVRLPGPSRILTLCEVQVYTGVNVALGKTAYQTTTEHHTRAASRAVDGNTDTNFFSGTCTVTADAGETDPSWWVDLGQSYMIARVVIFNRQDGSQDRLNPFNIHIGDSDQVSMNPKCGGDHRIALDRPSISVSCLWMMGRYVGVRLPGPSRILTLCEVQVYTGVNVALGKTAYQTTTEHHTRAASRAVDGNTDTNFFSGTCTVTADAGETDPSWWVDLGRFSDRLNPFNIHIGDSDQVSMNPKWEVIIASPWTGRPFPSHPFTREGPTISDSTPNDCAANCDHRIQHYVHRKWKKYFRNGTGDVDSCKLTGLVPGSQYDIDLVAVSRFGRSLAVSTSVITDTDPPSRLNVTKSSKTWLFLEWTSPVANILSYDLEISDEFSSTRTFLRLEGHTTSYNVTDLVPETTYVFKMGAFSEFGRSVDIPFSYSTGSISPIEVSTDSTTEVSTSDRMTTTSTTSPLSTESTTAHDSDVHSRDFERTTSKLTQSPSPTALNKDAITTAKWTTTNYMTFPGRSTEPPRISQTSTPDINKYTTSPKRTTEEPAEKLQNLVQGLDQSLPETLGAEDILAAAASINDIIKPADAAESEMSPSVLQTTAGIIEKLATAARGSQSISIENMETIADALVQTASAAIDVLPKQKTQIASDFDNALESDLIDTSATDLSPRQQLKVLKEKQKEKEDM
ncbi:hypothetical protein Bbelb_155870, partial [Branchiostoma belcheri]